ncbi:MULTISPECIES: hypothetical protein [unclassified Streptomyces]|uniref:hypothetical protein n=1 Tax=unclassified Streptomyces TaxID=2593676 RepID=UPI0005A7B38E
MQLDAGDSALLQLHDDGVEGAVLTVGHIGDGVAVVVLAVARPAVGSGQDERTARVVLQEPYAERLGLPVGDGVRHLRVPADGGVGVQVQPPPVRARALARGRDLVVAPAGGGVGEPGDAQAEGARSAPASRAS